MIADRERIGVALSSAGIEAAIATSPVNVTYLAGYRFWLDRLSAAWMFSPGTAPAVRALAMVEGAGAVTLVVPAVLALNVDGAGTRLRPFGSPGFEPLAREDDAAGELGDTLFRRPLPASATEALAAAVIERALDQAVIGVEMDGLPAGALADLRRLLPGVSFRDCSNLLRLLRSVKSPAEIERLRRALAVADACGAEVLESARPGTSMQELARRFRTAVSAAGAEVDHFAFGAGGRGIATQVDHHLGDRECMYVDFGCSHLGYLSDTGTTLILGVAGRVERGDLEALAECIAAGAGRMRPGVRASEVQGAMSRVAAAHGLTGCRPEGHGIGLEPRDYPILVPDNGLRIRDECVDEAADLALQAGMVVNLEAGVFRYGRSSCQLESTFVLTPDGAEPLLAESRCERLRERALLSGRRSPPGAGQARPGA